MNSMTETPSTLNDRNKFRTGIILRTGRDSSVGIATGYGLDDLRIESWWERDFSPHTSRSALGPTQPSVQWVPGLSRGQSGRGVVLTTNPLLVCRGQERVEVYLYPSPIWAFVSVTGYLFTVLPNVTMSAPVYLINTDVSSIHSPSHNTIACTSF
jgi:hypothetical protein